MKSFKILKILIISFFLFSCGSKELKIKISSYSENFCEGVVFDFINQSKEYGLDSFLIQALTAELSESGYSLKDSSLIKNFFTSEEKIMYFEHPEITLSPELIKRIGDILGVKWILGGKILNASQVGEYAKLELLIWIRETKEGKLLWYGYYIRDSESYRKILHFGKISDLYSLSLKMIKKDIIKDLKKVLICKR